MEIGKYAHLHSNANALRKFGPQFDNLHEATVRTFKKKYKDSISNNPQVLILDMHHVQLFKKSGDLWI